MRQVRMRRRAIHGAEGKVQTARGRGEGIVRSRNSRRMLRMRRRLWGVGRGEEYTRSIGCGHGVRRCAKCT